MSVGRVQPIIFTEQDIGRPMTDEEKAAHRNNLGLS